MRLSITSHGPYSCRPPFCASIRNVFRNSNVDPATQGSDASSCHLSLHQWILWVWKSTEHCVPAWYLREYCEEGRINSSYLSPSPLQLRIIWYRICHSPLRKSRCKQHVANTQDSERDHMHRWLRWNTALA